MTTEIVAVRAVNSPISAFFAEFRCERFYDDDILFGNWTIGVGKSTIGVGKWTIGVGKSTIGVVRPTDFDSF